MRDSPFSAGAIRRKYKDKADRRADNLKRASLITKKSKLEKELENGVSRGRAYYIREEIFELKVKIENLESLA